ncbi:MAG: anti-sigma factor antagonist [Armatimonadetes bacterium]|nr:anti-sigma factor antagonist [Armatimonadota bacterium]NIO75146.1 anti-sigma factor antagonist [Armatimonadota bacterium]NIO95770.1 anti-sigma factor antagonist [Armatimonadota bacterium]
MNLKIKSRRLETATGVVELIGEVDVYSAAQAKQKIHELLDGGVKHLLIDLSDTEYLDSTAMGVLVGVLKRVGESGGWVRLVGMKPRIRRLFEITRLDEILPIFETEKEALSDIGEKEGSA